LIVGVKASS